ncbi:hypothetical protein IVA96_30290 [Bradyrhizobium sp. 159]|uniref:hypothetical protein n=1 Tax=Bradyrhizobium sp. 159 TaxID=2782632 RepID=UPI001FF81BE3|nr:hypothetical protein [Bradyrhizobium sp. 159]MCK1620786.1 hypothetical protein [Bradyrhizobium sp. 159]
MMKRISDDRIAVIGLLALALWLFVVLPLHYRPPLVAATQISLGVCFVIPPESEGGIFGFAEFVQAFALLVLIFTVSGTRYQFRVETAPIRLWSLTYWSSGLIGAFALLSDLWFAQRYPLAWFLSSQAYWQFTLGLLFLSLVLIWLWYAYIRPPQFGRANAYKFTGAVYHYVMQGDSSDISSVNVERFLKGASFNTTRITHAFLACRMSPAKAIRCSRLNGPALMSIELLALLASRSRRRQPILCSLQLDHQPSLDPRATRYARSVTRLTDPFAVAVRAQGYYLRNLRANRLNVNTPD